MNKLQRFKQGLKDLTPLQQLNARATGSIWGAIGLSIAFIGMLYNMIFNKFALSQLGFSIFVLVLIAMQVVNYIGTKQQIALIVEAKAKSLEMDILRNL